MRELQSVVREALIVSAGLTILPAFLPSELHRRDAPSRKPNPTLAPMPDVDWGMLGSSSKRPPLERRDGHLPPCAWSGSTGLVILAHHASAGGQQNRAAEILGLSRVTLRAKLRHMQMSVEKVLARRETDSQQE